MADSMKDQTLSTTKQTSTTPLLNQRSAGHRNHEQKNHKNRVEFVELLTTKKSLLIVN
ncbi:unnamed protein product [Paramecium octaurelia]|uniref:Uncharacterized protein n=1 Tax=Paramecium octaurelia TaxID=43137 RepID=A0A8S1Y5P3_PAROT|nr:unnamed protein product [Paramecium octaurelia]